MGFREVKSYTDHTLLLRLNNEQSIQLKVSIQLVFIYIDRVDRAGMWKLVKREI